MSSRDEAVQAAADHLQRMPQTVLDYAHERAIKIVYDGDAVLFKRDEQRVDGSHPKDRHIACRYYLYFEVFANTINGIVVEATLPRKVEE